MPAEWSNLLPSCTDCNSARYHPFPNDQEELRGKANLFPLRDPQKRAKTPGEEQKEEPLLLNPTIDRPEEHLEFISEPGKEGLLRAALDKSGKESLIGQHSIKVYGLDRPQLIRHRMDHASRVLHQLRHVEKAALALEQDLANAKLRNELETEVTALEQSFLAQRMEHLGMVRQLVFPRVQMLAQRKGLRHGVDLLKSILASNP